MSQQGIVDIEGANPQIPTLFVADVGSAIPIANTLEILGGTNVTTVGFGNTIQINATGLGETITGDMGGPISPLLGNWNLIGGTIGIDDTPVRVVGSGNTLTVNVQTSQAIAASNPLKMGLSTFNSAQFTVDPDGFVSLIGGSSLVEHLTGDTGGILNPDGSNNFNLHGGTVVAGTSPVKVAGAGSTLTTNVQLSQAIAGTDATKVGLCNFDSASFAVDANGFVTASGTGLAKTITGDSGGALSPTAGNWNILGQQAGTVAVVDTIGSVSTLKVEDRTWVTQYVVDPSSTAGLRGTFTTIQSAINQVVSDGGGSSQYTTILIRPGSYTENIVMPAAVAINLKGMSPYPDKFADSQYEVRIIGNLTFTATAIGLFENIYFATSDATVPFAATNAAFSIKCYYCKFQSAGGNAISITTATSSASIFKFCYFGSNINLSSAGTTISFDDCDMPNGMTLTSTTTSLYSCKLNGVVSTTTSGTLSLFDCISDGAAFTINASTILNAFNLINNSNNGISGAGTVNLSGYASTGSATYTATTFVVKDYQSIIPRTTGSSTTITMAANDYLLSADTTSNAITVNLPTLLSKNKTFKVKDLVGNAATNNITVTTSGGAINIDGAATFVMNVNYGAAEFFYNGSTYEVL